jgi:hypothetical protein
VVVSGVLLAGWIAVAIWALAGRSDDQAGDVTVPVVADGTVAEEPIGAAGDDPHGDRNSGGGTAASGPDGVTPTRPTAESLVEVDEAWLLGHDDGDVDWGVIVESISGVDRGPIRIEAVFRDDAGVEVTTTESVLSGVPAGGRAVVAGSLSGPSPVPARLQVEVAVGRPLDASAFDGDGLEVRSLDRRTRPDGSEEITGLVVSSREEAVASLQLVLLWRGPDGAVVGSVGRDVDRVRPGVPAHFTIPLAEDRVPDGLPTELMWAQRDAED